MNGLEALAALPANSQTPSSHSVIEKKAQEFEALVLSQLLQPMFDSVETTALFGEGPEQDAYRTMLNDEFAKAIAQRGGVGVADQVKDALIRLQSSSGTPGL